MFGIGGSQRGARAQDAARERDDDHPRAVRAQETGYGPQRGHGQTASDDAADAEDDLYEAAYADDFRDDYDEGYGDDAYEADDAAPDPRAPARYAAPSPAAYAAPAAAPAAYAPQVLKPQPPSQPARAAYAGEDDADVYDDHDGDLAQGALAAFGLAKSYGGRQVVRDVSLNVRRGEAVGLLGPNGAGKTTCFYMVTGLVQADAGRIELDDHDVTQLPMYRRARLGIGYLPQEASIFRGLSVEDNIMGVLEVTEKNRARRREELDALLEEFKITHVRKSPSIALSGGERRRVEIARALASRPSFMLLDEPFAGIDPIAVGDIQALVRHLTTRGIGVLITDHNVRETLGLIDRAYIIHSGGVLMEGDPEAIVSSPDVRRLYLGEEFRL